MLGLVLWCLLTPGWASDGFRDHPPRSYTVVEGDTLWDIAGRFLNNPWSWPEVWESNTQIHNPHLIYPGDIIRMVYVDGAPRLRVNRGDRGRTIKLGPQIRSTPLEQPIPAIPLDAIDSFLSTSRIIDDPRVLQDAPYIVANGQGRVLSGAGDTLYVRGEFSSDDRNYGVYRGQAERSYLDPQTGEFLGTIVHSIGSVQRQEQAGDIATMHVSVASEELLAGDRLLASEERRFATSFLPTAPDNKAIAGTIIDVIGGVSQIGAYQNILINLGHRDGMKDGTVLAIVRDSKTRDTVTGELVTLPPKRVGQLMVYRAYNKMSFAIVMQASQPLHVGDSLRAP